LLDYCVGFIGGVGDGMDVVIVTPFELLLMVCDWLHCLLVRVFICGVYYFVYVTITDIVSMAGDCCGYFVLGYVLMTLR